MSVVLLVISFIAIVVYEAPDLIRKRQWGELALFIALVLLGFTISLFQAIGMPVPNPVKGIESLTERIARLFR
ncbi:MAG TPA: hypothetical protein GX509_08890 [Firmicutes bacterium]|nr:hypothetical protein [Bacillota bacterium]